MFSYNWGINLSDDIETNHVFLLYLNDKLTSRLHVGKKCGFNLHVGIPFQPLLLAFSGVETFDSTM